MKRSRGMSQCQAQLEPSVVTIGNFDGLHLGHNALVGEARKIADELGVRCVVLTFDPHPSNLLSPQHGIKRLYNISDLEERFAELGVDLLVVESFTTELSQRSAFDFVRQNLVECLGAKAVVVGHDFRFGAGRAGDFQLLSELGAQFGFTAKAVDAVKLAGTTISSSQVRQCLARGDVVLAGEFLGRPYEFFGEVIKGDGRGRELGFPTANLNVSVEVQCSLGVYAGHLVSENQKWPCVMNIGQRPTFKGIESPITVEAHLLGVTQDLYGQRVRLSLEHFIRHELKFSGRDELIKQVQQDIQHACGKLGVAIEMG